MPLPTDDLIVWASSDVNLPNLAGPNKAKPIDDLILKGWDFKQKPAADEFNYVLNNLGMHVSYLEESKTYTFTGDLVGTATSIGSDNVTFDVSVVSNSHNHISANISDATSLNTPNMVVRRDINGDISVRYVVGGLTGNALTATTLETPRTINGTSFNGSSNITTSSWGTSRTLTLAGAVTGSVSIDGSGNVTLNTSVSSTSGVSILTGTISHGGTIPLPSGYSEGQCRWMVSMNNDNASNIGWDIDEDGAHVHYKQQVYTNGRVVTSQTYLGSNNSPPGWISSTANYIIIGVK